jgi:hypothetical protein
MASEILHTDDLSSSPDEEAAALAQSALSAFLERMHSANDPGAGPCVVVGRKTARGWHLDYDPASGGGQIGVVVGVDGLIYSRQGARTERVRRCPVVEWLFGVRSPIEPKYRALGLAQRLDDILQGNRVSSDTSVRCNDTTQDAPEDTRLARAAEPVGGPHVDERGGIGDRRDE